MTQYELSKKSGVSQSSLSTLISQGSMPKIGTLQKICDGFGITLSQFFQLEDGKFPDLSEEQTKILETWDSLSSKEKEVIKEIIQSVIKLR